jgi:hypothetical protein
MITIKQIEEIQEQHPYKQAGNSESYSKYSEGWNDACEEILSLLQQDNQGGDILTYDQWMFGFGQSEEFKQFGHERATEKYYAYLEQSTPPSETEGFPLNEGVISAFMGPSEEQKGMSAEEWEKKLQDIVYIIAYEQTAEEQADDLFNKMGMLNEFISHHIKFHLKK